nr:MAG TPA: Minor structural protein [Caudoviricetes sp.]
MIELSLDLNKSIKSFQNRITLRQGDIGEKVLISIYDNKKPVDLTEQHKVKLEGNLRNSDYVEGEANPYNSEKGKYVFQFQSKDVSIIGKYQRAFLRVYDENDNRISSEEVHIEVLKDADISQSQATTYVSKLDDLLENMDQEFESFMDEKEIDYGKLDQKCNELGSELTSIQIESTGIKKTQSDILQSIKDNKLATKTELENAKQESSANVIYQVIGKEKVRLTFVLDFKNKIADSTVENPNIFSWTTGSTLQKPSSFVVKPDQNSYDKVSSLDNVSQLILQNKNGTITQAGAFWDLLKIMKDELGEQFFITRGAVDLNSQIEILRKETILQWNVWGKGSGPSGNRLVVSAWSMGANGWAGDTSTTSNSITKIGNKTVASNNKHFIDNDGFVNITAYAEAADGTTYSSISIDYANLEVSLEISMNEFIESMIAANHGEKIATQEEAEAGTDNTKIMTPLLTREVIDKQAVSIAGNQTIGGIKNFKDGLMINDDLVVSKNDYSVFILDSTTSSVIAEGKLCFILHGSLVVVEGSIKFKTDVAYVAMISSSLPDSMIATINNATLVGHIGNNSAKGIFVEKGTKNIKANSVFVANEWFTCNGVYWAGKE